MTDTAHLIRNWVLNHLGLTFVTPPHAVVHVMTYISFVCVATGKAVFIGKVHAFADAFPVQRYAVARRSAGKLPVADHLGAETIHDAGSGMLQVVAKQMGRHRRGGFEIDIQVMAVLLRRKQRALRRIFRGLAAGDITEFAVVFIQQFLHRQTQNTA